MDLETYTKVVDQVKLSLENNGFEDVTVQDFEPGQNAEIFCTYGSNDFAIVIEPV